MKIEEVDSKDPKPKSKLDKMRPFAIAAVQGALSNSSTLAGAELIAESVEGLDATDIIVQNCWGYAERMVDFETKLLEKGWPGYEQAPEEEDSSSKTNDEE